MAASTSPSASALKAISLVTLTAQNSLLTIILHYSRISVPPSQMYSAASAVLLNELLKMAVSLCVSLTKAINAQPQYTALSTLDDDDRGYSRGGSGGLTDLWNSGRISRGTWWLVTDVFSSDCWKLSIPACLYVVQNNLQFVAASNLDAPTFQVSYNLKILTTAICSVVMLGRRLSGRKWLALTLLAIGVATVQLQSISTSSTSSSESRAGMNRIKGLTAVLCACITSGLAGVYFEMVLKGSKTDLWTRNVQLSIFSIGPAVLPVFFPEFAGLITPVTEGAEKKGLLENFGFWAWAVVITQVVGGLTTALVIKYADNIVKGFATSLAIIISSLMSYFLFSFRLTPIFLLGALIVVFATYMYNDTPPPSPIKPPSSPLPTSSTSHHAPISLSPPAQYSNLASSSAATASGSTTATRRSPSPTRNQSISITVPQHRNSVLGQYRPQGDPPPLVHNRRGTVANTPEVLVRQFADGHRGSLEGQGS